MAIGSVSAIKQDNLKRLFAFSTIANIGYVMIGLACVNDEAIKASFLYIFIYTIATLGVFSFIMMLRKENSKGNLEFFARKKLLWDGEGMRITNLEEANQFVTRDYRKGWEV